MKTAKIGLLGFGNVGGGTYKILTDNKQIIEKRTGISPEIVKILQRNKKKKTLCQRRSGTFDRRSRRYNKKSGDRHSRGNAGRYRTCDFFHGTSHESRQACSQRQ